MGALGILFFLAAAYALSSNRSEVRWQVVAWGLGLQVLLAVLVLRTPLGFAVQSLGLAFNRFIQYAGEGTQFVFGELAEPENGVIFAFQILPLIILVSSISAILYRLGAMQKIVTGLAFIMQRGMRVSGAESLTVAANLFLGQAEAPLTVRPYLARMTRSELMTIMTSGMATVSGAMLVAYVQIGGARAEDLVTAVVMTAPACVMLSKILEPETGMPETMGQIPSQTGGLDRNVIDAASRGASEGLNVALQVGAVVLTFVALISILNGMLSGLKGLLGWAWFPGSVQSMLGPLLAPVAWLIGIAWQDAPAVGNLFGTRLVLNEFISFAELAAIKDTLDPRSALIASYGLCGFANVGSVGILVGALGAILPQRRAELAALGLRALLAATLCNLTTAAITGLIAFTPLLGT